MKTIPRATLSCSAGFGFAVADCAAAVRFFTAAFVALFIAGCSGGDDRADVTDVADVESSVAGSLVPDDEADTADVQDSIPESLPPDVDRPLPEGDEPEVLGPLGETEVEFETDDGVVQIGTAEVPTVIADGFPIPNGLVVQIASQAGDEAGFSGVSELTFEELVSFYDIELDAAGYESAQTRLVDGVVAVYEFIGLDGRGNVAISSAPGGGRSVLVTFTS